VKQSLLLPPVLELPPREAECVRNNMEKLLSYGLEVEAYGGMSFVVKAVPAVLQDADPGRLLRDVAEELVEQDRAVQLDRLRSHVFSRMACHSVVRAGRSLEPAEMDALLRALDRKPGLLTCPHGRPVVVGWSLQEIQKRFQRI
jgi:DNA mismatch repair protein MutL